MPEQPQETRLERPEEPKVEHIGLKVTPTEKRSLVLVAVDEGVEHPPTLLRHRSLAQIVARAEELRDVLAAARRPEAA